MERVLIQNDLLSGSLKEHVKREFIRRCRTNPRYSLRAYAKYLEIDQSFLSKLLNGQRRMTPALEAKLAGKFSHSFLKSEKDARKTKNKNDSFIKLTEDEYEAISNWYHFAILELIKTKDFKPNIQYIAQELGIHSEEVKDALDRLLRLGFIKVAKNKWTLISKNHIWSNPVTTSLARQKLQIELAKKAIVSLENIPFSLRENGSLTVAVDTRKLPEFKEKINFVLKDLSDFFQPATTNLDSVYQVTISFFPISKNIRENQNENR